MFAKVGLASVLMILGVAGPAIGRLMVTPVEEGPKPAGSQTKAATEQINCPQPTSNPKSNEHPSGDVLTIRGQVLDPDGKPVAGAQIVLGHPQTDAEDWRSPRRLTTSGANGWFEASLPPETLPLPRQKDKDLPTIAAVARRFGPGWLKLDCESAGKELTLRLCRDDVPIEGRILNLEGRPVRGLTVYVASIMELPGDLLKKIRENAGKPDMGHFWDETGSGLFLGKEGPIPPVRTGSDGRFHLTAIGRDREVILLVEGEPFEESVAVVYTSSDPAYAPLLLSPDGPRKPKLLGPRFDFVVAPGRVIEGVIRDRDSGRPVSGARAQTGWLMLSATSDAEGRFRIPGQPKMANNFVAVTTEGRPYFKAGKLTGDPAGYGPIHVDFALKRGVWFQGRVKNRADGRPIKAIVEYHPMRDNPHLKECDDANVSNGHLYDSEFRTDADGRFRAVALSGGGLLAVRTVERDFFAAQPLSPKDADNVLPDAISYQAGQYQALVPVHFADAEKVAIPDIVVAQRRTQHVKVVGPDGKPVVEIRVFGNVMRNPNGRASSGSELTFIHNDPGKLEPILVVNPDETAGAVLVVKGDESEPTSIKLQPAATVTGRMVDEKGRPRPNVPFVVIQDLKTTRGERYPGEPPTGPDGRFRLKGLVAGVSYTLHEINFGTMAGSGSLNLIGKPRWTVKPGETQDWGDVQVK